MSNGGHTDNPIQLLHPDCLCMRLIGCPGKGRAGDKKGARNLLVDRAQPQRRHGRRSFRGGLRGRHGGKRDDAVTG